MLNNIMSLIYRSKDVEIKDLKNRVGILQAETKTLKSDINHLTGIRSSLIKQIHVLESKITKMENNSSGITVVIPEFKKEMKKRVPVSKYSAQ